MGKATACDAVSISIQLPDNDLGKVAEMIHLFESLPLLLGDPDEAPGSRRWLLSPVEDVSLCLSFSLKLFQDSWLVN